MTAAESPKPVTDACHVESGPSCLGAVCRDSQKLEGSQQQQEDTFKSFIITVLVTVSPALDNCFSRVQE